MLQNEQVTALTVSELLRENQNGVKLRPPPRLGLMQSFCLCYESRFRETPVVVAIPKLIC